MSERKMLEIQESAEVPNSTYFRVGDTEPTVNDDGSITIYTGQGSRRSSWGAPGVTSTVVLEDCDLVAIHVGFYHKHGSGQFWRYYTTDGQTVQQVRWSQLPDSTRQQVLDAYQKMAPGWAKSPGKLRSQYAKPTTRTIRTFKLVKLAGGQMFSLYDGRTEYQIGKRLVEAVAPDAGEADWGEVIHNGGYYSHTTVEGVMRLWESGNLVPNRCLTGVEQVALLECEASGRIAHFPNGKLASTYLKPVQVLEVVAA